MSGRVLFVGCGPGAADLLTLRAVRALQAADIVIWNRVLIDRQTLAEHTRADAQIVEWPPATRSDIDGAYDRALADDLLVVRLKGGDPSVFGQLEPELSAVRERGLACEIVPGVSVLGATGAALGHELASRTAPLLLVDAGALVAGGLVPARIAAYSVNRDPGALQRALLAHGLPGATTCTVAIEVTRRDEMLIACPLDELAETIDDMGTGLMTVVIAGTSPAS